MSSGPGRFWRRLKALVRWRQHTRDLADELAYHLDRKQEYFEARGMSPSEASAAARRALGNVTAVRESTRSIWLASWFESVWQDVAYGFRSLRRQPLFAAIAVLGLTGGLGFSAAAFGGISAFTLRGWDIAESERMVSVYGTSPGAPSDRFNAGFSLDQLNAFESRARSLVGVIAWDRTRPDGSGGITASPVRAGYFKVLGIPMFRGREFTPNEDRIGAPQALIVLSYRYWASELASAPDVLGRVVRVKGVPFTVIGVAAAGFVGTDLVAVDAWIPLTAMAIVQPRSRRAQTALAHSDECCVSAAARLAPGVSYESAAAELTTLLAQAQRPGVDTVPRGVDIAPFTIVGTSGPGVAKEVMPVFVLIAGGVGVVLLLATANVANLLLARAATRRREIRIRLALGASRARIVRQLMTESLLLAVLAGIPALLIARFVPPLVMRTMTPMAINLQFSVDATLVSFTLGLAVLSCVLFGLTPALYATRDESIQRRSLPLRSIFLSAQVVFCMALLVSAGLFLRQLRAEQTSALGFTTNGINELTVFVPGNVVESERAARLSVELPDIANNLSLMRVAYRDYAPFQRTSRFVQLPRETAAQAMVTVEASPEYFSLLDIHVLAGRTYLNGAAGLHEVVINAALAEQLGGVAAAIGEIVILDSVPRTIVGVIPTVRDIGVRAPLPAVYHPIQWNAAPRIIVRGSADDARRFADAIMARDPSLTVVQRSYAWYFNDALSTSFFAASVAGAIGILALVLASVGMFGVFSYWVGQRKHDISVHMALGATSTDVIRMVVTSSAKAMGWGVAIGLPVSLGVAHLLKSSLYGLGSFDPLAFVLALSVLVTSALCATVVPVWRAVHVQPMLALRSD